MRMPISAWNRSRAVAVLLVAGLAVTLVDGAAAAAAPPGPVEPGMVPPPPQQQDWRSTLAPSGTAALVTQAGGLVGGPAVATPVPESVPASTATVALLDREGAAVDGTAVAPGSPVSVAVLAGKGVRLATASAPTLSVSTVDSMDAAAAGLDKVAFTVTVSGPGAATQALARDGKVRLTVDYREFADEFGADWAGRLRLARFPRCALIPRSSTCDGPRPVAGFVNDRENQRIEVTLPLAELVGAGAERTAGSDGPSTVSGFGLLAGASSSTGDYATTSLNPAGSWSVGTQSGNFSWSYPVRVPAPPAGSAPGISVSYSAQAIDGLTADQNTQGGVSGPGWSVGTGFVERRYRSCGADGGATADQCWFSDNGTFSVNGLNAELVHIGPEMSLMPGWEAFVYRLEDHSGWVVRRYMRTDQSARGGFGVDNNGEYWQATAPDGTRYWFGYGAESGDGNPGTALRSIQTVPVVGNHSGEPCNTQSNNWCHQGYRWNLDRIEDASGRVTTFRYAQEQNFYGVRGMPAVSEPYVSAGVLTGIEYGQLTGNAATANSHTHAVSFSYDYRCDNPDTSGACAVAPTDTTAANFPDIPYDQYCPDSYCTHYSPTFFNKQKLTRITATARTAAGTMTEASRDLFSYTWVDADASGSDPARLWLNTIQHVGRQQGGSTALPAVRIVPSMALANRVDYNLSAGVSQMKYHRVGKIYDEHGGQIGVTYTQPKPCPSPWPASPPTGWTSFADNTWACFQRYWVPPSGPTGPSIWHKYVVDYVTQADQSGGVQAYGRMFDYDYPDVSGSNGGMAWHSDQNEAAPVSTRYWAEYRGFQRVRVTTGTAQNAYNQSMTEHVFHRGMDGDINSHSNPGGVPKDVATTPSSLGPVPDAAWAQGRTREEIVTNVVGDAPGPEVYSGAVTTYAAWSTAGTNGTSWQVEPSIVYSRAAHGGATRYGKVTSTFDSHPWQRRLVKVVDLGNTDSAYADIAGDDGNYDAACTTTSYTPGSGRFPNGLPHRSAAYPSASCTGTLLSDTRTYYDSASVSAVADPAAPAEAPWWGTPTAVWRATGGGVTEDAAGTAGNSLPAIVDRTGFEANGFFNPPGWGRVSGRTDARGNQTTVGYTQFAAGAGTRLMTTRNPLNHTAVTEFDEFGNQVRSTDPDNRSGYVCYDDLGRATKVYDPSAAGGTSCGGSPSVSYAYNLTFVPGRFDASVSVPRWAVQTRTLFAASADSYNPNAGTDTYLESWTLFDGFGRAAQTNTPSPVGGRIVTRSTFDSTGNPVRVSAPFWASAASGPAWTVVADTSVPRDTRTTFDPLGRPRTVEQLDDGVQLRRVETRYSAAATTMYAPTATGSPAYGATVHATNARGHVWRITEYDNAGANRDTSYRYDQSGRLLQITDPAGNVTRMTYNQLGWRLALDDPNAGYSDTRYWATGHVRYTVDANNRTVYHRIDALGRTVDTFNKVADPTATNRLAAYFYDGAWTGVTGGTGQLTATDAYWPAGTRTVHTEVRAFDTAGRPVTNRVWIPAADDPALGGDDPLFQVYDTTTRFTRTGVAYQTVYPGVAGSNLPNAETVSATFNDYGQQTSIGGYTRSVAYDALGRPVQTELGAAGQQAGLTLRTAYQDSDGRLSRLTATTGTGQLLQDDTYSYDAPGNPTRITHDTGWNDETECFDYDGRQRLQRAYTLNGLAACAAPGTTVTPSGPAPYLEAYGVDALHRITAVNGLARNHAATTPASGCRAGTYPTQATKPHAISSASGSGGRSDTFSYDCSGALVSQTTTGGPAPGSTTYTWDTLQRLRSTTNPTGTTTNTYDAANNRVLRVESSNGVRTIYFGGTEVRYVPWFGVYTARTYSGHTRREFDGTVTNYATNHQGSITASTNAKTGGTAVTRYTPYGGVRTFPNSRPGIDDHNFLGLVDDPETNTNYLNNRHYQPTFGEFISPDPLADPSNPATLNRYTYSRANPISLSDPSGLRPDTDSKEDLDKWFKRQKGHRAQREVYEVRCAIGAIECSDEEMLEQIFRHSHDPLVQLHITAIDVAHQGDLSKAEGNFSSDDIADAISGEHLREILEQMGISEELIEHYISSIQRFATRISRNELYEEFDDDIQWHERTGRWMERNWQNVVTWAAAGVCIIATGGSALAVCAVASGIAFGGRSVNTLSEHGFSDGDAWLTIGVDGLITAGSLGLVGAPASLGGEALVFNGVVVAPALGNAQSVGLNTWLGAGDIACGLLCPSYLGDE